MSMKVLDGDGSAYYVDAEGVGSVDDPAKLQRVLVGGFRKVQCEITRPANETVYAAKDCLADNAPSIETQVFAGAARINNGHGTITRARIATDKVDWTAALVMFVYNAEPAGGFIADNAAFDNMYADEASLIGKITFPAFSNITGGAGSASEATTEGLNIGFECVGDVDDLYFQLYIPSDTPTPASGQKFTITIDVIQD